MEGRVDEIRLMINPQMRFAGRLATQNCRAIVTGHSHLILHRSTKYGVFIQLHRMLPFEVCLIYFMLWIIHFSEK